MAFGRTSSGSRPARAAPGSAHSGLRRAAGIALLAVETGIVAVLGVTLARIAWLVIEPGGAVTPSSPLVRLASPGGQSVAVSRSDYARLTSDDPFHGDAAPAAIKTVRTTQLNLQLRGVRAESDDTSGMAIISVSGAPAKRFQPGEQLLDGVVLERVMADRVIIRKNGEPEALLMPAADGHLSVLGRVPEVPETPSGPATGNMETNAPAGVQLSSMNVEPVYRNQALYGYRGLAIAAGAAEDDLNIIPSDIILEIDGTPVSQFDVTGIAGKLSSKQPVRFRIDRAGVLLEQTMSPSGTY